MRLLFSSISIISIDIAGIRKTRERIIGIIDAFRERISTLLIDACYITEGIIFVRCIEKDRSRCITSGRCHKPIVILRISGYISYGVIPITYTLHCRVRSIGNVCNNRMISPFCIDIGNTLEKAISISIERLSSVRIFYTREDTCTIVCIFQSIVFSANRTSLRFFPS